MFDTKIRWVKFADSEEDLIKHLANKSCQPIRINSKALLLVYHKNTYFLVKNRCPHQGKTLENATCESGFIVCPWHRYGFNLENGRGGGLHLENYPIEIREDGWYAGFEYVSFF